MNNTVQQGRLTAMQEAQYLCTYINQYGKHYDGHAKIKLHAKINQCNKRIEHDLLLPLIDDAFRFGVFKVDSPSILFNLQLADDRLTFALYCKLNHANADERTQVTFIKLKHKLVTLYPESHILYRDYYLDSYLILLQINLA